MEIISTMTRYIEVEKKKKLYTATPTQLPLYQTRARTTHSVTDHRLYKQVLISDDRSVSPPCHHFHTKDTGKKQPQDENDH